MSIILIFSTRYSLKLSQDQKRFYHHYLFKHLYHLFRSFFSKNMEILRDHFCHFSIFKQFDYFIIAQEICITVNIFFTSNTLIQTSMLYFHCHSFLLCPLLMILAIFWHIYIFFCYILEYVLIFSRYTFIFLSM